MDDFTAALKLLRRGVGHEPDMDDVIDLADDAIDVSDDQIEVMDDRIDNPDDGLHED